MVRFDPHGSTGSTNTAQALSVDDGANNRETGGTAGFMSNAFQDAGTVHARLLTVVP